MNKCPKCGSTPTTGTLRDRLIPHVCYCDKCGIRARVGESEKSIPLAIEHWDEQTRVVDTITISISEYQQLLAEIDRLRKESTRAIDELDNTYHELYCFADWEDTRE